MEIRLAVKLFRFAVIAEIQDLLKLGNLVARIALKLGVYCLE